MGRRTNDIEKRVMLRYPETEKEKTCAQEKQKRNYLRQEFKKQLIGQGKEKVVYGK